MGYTFQCLLFCTLPSEGKPTVLLSASGSKIFLFSITSGDLISIWQSQQIRPASSSVLEKSIEENDGTARPAKRRKNFSPNQGSDSSFAEIVTEDAQTRPVKSSKPQVTDPNVIKLAATSDSRFVVAVTDEDKCVRVLQLDSNGQLQQLSARQESYQESILCGDKFGDVYALPLVWTNPSNGPLLQSHVGGVVKEDNPTVEQFIPSASLRTVHTVRNQEALRHQQNMKNQKSSKNLVEFEHELLLGHVSLLTDLICVSVPGATLAGSQDRTYIISADRDEHIRISRGMPQSHVIEGFCLGHTQFVSKLCVLGWNPRILISGGGDDYLLVWDWISSRVLHKTDLRAIVVGLFDRKRLSGTAQDQEPEVADTAISWNQQIAVSELCAVEAKTVAGQVQRQVALACEGIPAIFFFDITENSVMQHVVSVATEGAVINFALSGDHDRIAYAMNMNQEALPQPLSTDQNKGLERSSIGILKFDVLSGRWENDHGLEESITRALTALPGGSDGFTGDKAKSRGSISSLYSLENLRKRGQDE
ncbi:MAG: hypothetical protein Q9166_001687 [cf. Caloplaca sp. 2 TL-2023]